MGCWPSQVRRSLRSPEGRRRLRGYGRRAAADISSRPCGRRRKSLVLAGSGDSTVVMRRKPEPGIPQPGKPGPNAGELLAVGLMEGGNVTPDRFPARELVDSRHYKAPLTAAPWDTAAAFTANLRGLGLRYEPGDDQRLELGGFV